MKFAVHLLVSCVSAASIKFSEVAEDCTQYYSYHPTLSNEWCWDQCTAGQTQSEIFTKVCRVPEYEFEADAQEVIMDPGEPCFSTQVYGFTYGEADALAYVDMDAAPTKVAYPAECQKRCQDTEGCVWWHWQLVNDNGFEAGTCVIKSSDMVEKAASVDTTAVVQPADYNWCNAAMGGEAGACSTVYDCLTCDGSRKCTWLSKNHLTGPRHCADHEEPQCFQPLPTVTPTPTYYPIPPTPKPTAKPTTTTKVTTTSGPTTTTTAKPTTTTTAKPKTTTTVKPTTTTTVKPTTTTTAKPTTTTSTTTTTTKSTTTAVTKGTSTTTTTKGTTHSTSSTKAPVTTTTSHSSTTTKVPTTTTTTAGPVPVTTSTIPPSTTTASRHTNPTGFVVGAASGGIAAAAGLGYAGYALKGRFAPKSLNPNDLEMSADCETAEADAEQNVNIHASFYN